MATAVLNGKHIHNNYDYRKDDSSQTCNCKKLRLYHMWKYHAKFEINTHEKEMSNWTIITNKMDKRNESSLRTVTYLYIIILYIGCKLYYPYTYLIISLYSLFVKIWYQSQLHLFYIWNNRKYGLKFNLL